MREHLLARIAGRLAEGSVPSHDAAHLRDGAPRPPNCGTYASRRVDTAALDGLRSVDSLSPELRARRLALRAGVQRLEQQLGRAPRAAEVAAELGWTLSALHGCMTEAGAAGLRAGDAPIDDAIDAAALAGAQVAELSNPQVLAVLERAFQKLADREQFVMEMVYERGLRIDDVALTIGVIGSRAEQLHDGAIARLLESLNAATRRVRPEG